MAEISSYEERFTLLDFLALHFIKMKRIFIQLLMFTAYTLYIIIISEEYISLYTLFISVTSLCYWQKYVNIIVALLLLFYFFAL